MESVEKDVSEKCMESVEKGMDEEYMQQWRKM